MDSLFHDTRVHLVNGTRRSKLHNVHFEKQVELYVGSQNDLLMTKWPHELGVPHSRAQVFAEYYHCEDDEDGLSLLAAHVPEQHVPDVPIFQDPRIVRGDDDHHEPSDGGSDESEDSQLPEQCIILH
jgi:hypothetical protein